MSPAVDAFLKLILKEDYALVYAKLWNIIFYVLYINRMQPNTLRLDRRF